MIKYRDDMTPEETEQLLAEVAALDAVYDSLSPEDADSINRRDPDDPHTFALDHKGRP